MNYYSAIRYLCFAFLLLNGNWAVTQTLNPNKQLTQYSIDTWGDGEGLISGGVLSVKQDKQGYIWLGTFNGVFRFDGVHFKKYNKSNTPAFSNDGILSIQEDYDGRIWAGSNGGGIYVISKDTVVTITTREGLSDNSITSLEMDDSGTMFIGTRAGLTIYKDSIYSVYNEFKTEQGIETNLSVHSTFKDSKGTFWVGTNKGLFRYSDGKLIKHFFNNQPSANIEVFDIIETGDNRFFIGTFGHGLFEIIGDSFEQIELPNGVNKINYLYVDSNSSLWICHQNGVIRYHNDQFSNLSTQQGLSEDAVEEVIEDMEGSIWITTYYGGIHRLSDGIFNNYTIHEGLSNNTVHSIYQDIDSSVWIGTTNGLNQFSNGVFTNYSKENGDVPGNLIRDVLRHSNGDLWVATYDGLARRNSKGTTYYTVEDGLASNQTRLLYEDSRGVLWIGTRNGLNTFKDDKFERYTVEDGLLNDFILSIHEKSTGEMWFGTSGGGIAVYKDGGFTNFTTEDGLPSNVVFRIYEDDQNVLWISTNNGLCRYDGEFFYGFKSENGFLNSAIFQVLEDDYGYFWMTCDFGIVKAQKSALNDYVLGKMKSNIPEVSYKQVDGLKRSECTGAAQSLKDYKGNLWFATLGGLAIVNPIDSIINTSPPITVVEKFIVDQNDIKFQRNELVELPPASKNFEIRFTGLSLKVPTRNKFRYRLEGLDDDWINPGTRRAAYYSKLPPGEYTFRVKSSNNDGIWSEEEARLTFYIYPLFYQTLTFYIACGITFIFILLLIYHWRVRSIKKEQIKLKSIVAERTQEIQAQKEEIEAQRDKIEERNALLRNTLEEKEKKNNEIELQKEQIETKSKKLEEAQEIIREQNLKLVKSNILLEDKVQQRTEELKSAYQDLLVANKDLDSFMYRSSHDLKGPISRLLGLCYLGKLEIENNGPITYLEKLELTAMEMDTMLSKLIRVTEIKSRYIEVQKIDIKHLVNEVYKRLLNDNSQINVQLETNVEYINSDPFLLNILFENIIQNSIDYQDTNKKERFITTKITNGEDQMLKVSVIDNGIGISSSYLSKIFDMFFKGTEESKGTGIGLYVVKLIISKLKGKVKVNPDNSNETEIQILIPIG